ncbi:helix-turn-helix domain-containing protein [candidate division WOR-3 bacterium]|nr:helix-turn-helix domain-containing protein [candidate division WOR-3 bacterium]
MAGRSGHQDAFAREMGDLLGQARVRAGLAQRQVGIALGLKPRDAQAFVSRIEHGRAGSPTLRLVLDFLRACRATADDLKPFLIRHLSEPLAVPERRARKPRSPRPRPEPPENLELRRKAAGWKLQQVVEDMLHRELTVIGAPPRTRERRDACLVGRKVFRVLCETRDRPAQNRAKRLARARAWAEKKAVPAEAVAHLEKAATALLAELRQDGRLDLLPLLDEARHLALLGPRNRLLSDHQLCVDEHRQARLKDLDALKERRVPIDDGVVHILASAGITGNDVGNYMGSVNGFVNACISTRPGTPEREANIALILSVASPRYTNRALLERIAAFVQQLWDAGPSA